MANQKGKEKKKTQKEINLENLERGLELINAHPIFGHLPMSARYEKKGYIYGSRLSIGKNTYCYVSSDGGVSLNADLHLPAQQWAYLIAHCLLHLAFGHFDEDKMPGYMISGSDGKPKKKVDCNPAVWNMACDIYVTKFLNDCNFFNSIYGDPFTRYPSGLNDENKLYDYLMDQGISPDTNIYSTAFPGGRDMQGLEQPLTYDVSKHQRNRYTEIFAIELAHSVSKVISTVAGHEYQDERRMTPASLAARWFIDHYPLLGGLAAHFKLIEDYKYCQSNDIQIAAVDINAGEIYVNPTAHYNEEEWKFVLAHEYLHAGLQHGSRCQGRDHYLWNVACDFVINGWLHQMNIGKMPEDGLLYDESLNNLSAEEIYDTIIKDMKKYAKLDTFRGYGKRDIIDSSNRFGNRPQNGMDLDEFCKSALQQGLEYHQSHGRGLIPAGLIEEIKALSMPPIPWDVQLANWFQIYFAPLEKHRSYARPSRRQAATPDIPRPRYVPLDIPTDSRTFGVVVDTSGSMSPKQIGMALGSIASYAAANEVPFARVVFCDAAPYDAGYLAPEDIAGRVQVKGRGGTALQPAIDLLEKATDFPKDGPILLITDGFIENNIRIRRDHAWLLPRGGYGLPFRTKAPVFRFTE